MTTLTQRLFGEGMVSTAVSGILHSPKATIGLIFCVLLVLAAIFAPLLAPQNPYDLMQIDMFDAKLPPLSESMNGMTYWLGTDAQGRDMLSAMLYGLRTSLGVGLTAGFLAMFIGSALGLLAAYSGGRLDAFLMRLVDLMLGFPTILVALLILAVLGQGTWKVIMALVFVQWAYFARAARAAALVEVNKDYVEAARCLGLSRIRILFGHLLPNCLPPLIVIGTIQIASAIAAEATLSFLGIGLPITEPSLGLLISNGYQVLLAGLYWISVFPGLLLLTLVFSINIVGDRLREVLNPRLAK
ncbi:ABC transporter permease [Pseudochrobactrum asaccharolyticum]|jgi:peptide/nickel transport system permease protein|uniref:Peptide/nickel transport system permease protein n=1 Tax=Pseudochrobactrum asaccharolyticum TaxID=354351 RepID=A0A366DRK4_9HYPH|nr:ABC transporter permease [Pseudochrobactrum asaccharolyticum]MBX8803035.1 ABC transporter permease [Ochrobactrum sp. MR28]MBX8817073.1 ABC transporter permease [Ochrobactrum sp. MR31]MDR2311921.1 ABC transporter permease [Brucellaceae bacterium]RBO92109.1 peptide/nickel transport system permease protein [Pseudochrobactrum asaccharolyticum]